MTFTVTLGRPAELSAEERQQRIRRAAELLEGFGWVFDEHISSLTQAMLDNDNALERNTLYQSIRAAADLKGRLVQIVNSKALEDKRNGRA